MSQHFLRTFAPNDTFICKGKPITLNGIAKWGSLPYHYYWGASDTNSSITITPFTDTLLILKVTDNIGCISIDSVKVLSKDLPTITPNADYRVCYGDSTEFDAGNSNMGMQYLWHKNGSYFANSQKILVKDSGLYTVQMIDSFGCDAFDTVAFFVNDPVIVGPLQDVALCKFDTITLHAFGAQQYEWREQSTNAIVSTVDSLTTAPIVNTTYIRYP